MGIAAGLNELQRQREKWVKANFPDDEELDSVLGVVEEVGELAHSLLKRKQGIRGTEEEHNAKIKDAIGDIVVFLAGVATHEGLEFGTVVAEVWEEVLQRNWVDYTQHGMPPPQLGLL